MKPYTHPLPIYDYSHRPKCQPIRGKWLVWTLLIPLASVFAWYGATVIFNLQNLIK